jgi:hypothetical protein
MTDRPETYALSSEEWLEVNRALAGASLGLLHWYVGIAGRKAETRKERQVLVSRAQEILSKSYEDARARMGARE